VEIQLHPATGRGTVRTIRIERRGARVLAVLAAAWVSLALSLLWTAPQMTLRWFRHESPADITRENSRLAVAERKVMDEAGLLRDRALATGDRLTRIAFLYDVTPASWPRELDPDAGTVSANDASLALAGLDAYLAGLERGRLALAGREKENPELPERVPSTLPLASGLFAPSAIFGPRVSPWTGENEFFPGLELATAAGTPVTASGAGRVAFAGRVRRSPTGWLWRLGNAVVLDHGGGIATVYGHLGRVDVGVGRRIARGDRIGTVGASGWAMVPQLHYELWRFQGGRWRPTDPHYAILNHRVDPSMVSLARMLRTGAPGPLERLPGVR
jgi:hypothetical protein